MRSIKGYNNDSPVCLFQDEKSNISMLTSVYVRSRLRVIVTLLGVYELGFTKEDIGLHLIRSGGAMAMFLSGTSVIIIQRVGRWSSEAFLEYIREQVESFTLDVLKNMLKYEEFLNLNCDNDPDIDEDLNSGYIQNEDGLDSVPFTVNFSNLALNDIPKDTDL